MILTLLLMGCDTTAGPGFSKDPPQWTAPGVPLPVCADASEHRWAFTDVAGELGLQDLDGRNRGVAVADFDDNGVLDILTGNPGDAPHLWLGQQDGTFRDQATGVPTSGWDSALAAADYDNDGDTDLFIACGGMGTTCTSALFRNDGVDASGDVRFTDVSDTVAGLASTPGASKGGAWADYDGDGDLDLFVAMKDLEQNYFDGYPSNGGGDISVSGGPPAPDFDAPTTDRLYRNDGPDGFADVSAAAGLADPDNHHRSVWLDHDEDGDLDLYLTGLFAPARLMENRGGRFVEVTPANLDVPKTNFASLSQDFDNDGHMDILAAGSFQGALCLRPDEWEPHGLFLGNGDGSFRSAALATELSDADDRSTPFPTMGLQTEDIDGDGYLEVLFGHGNPNVGGAVPNQLFRGLPGGPEGVVFEEISDLIQTRAVLPDGTAGKMGNRTHGIAIFDYDRDGDHDIFLGNGGLYDDQYEPNRLFRNDAPCRFPYVELDFQLGEGVNRDGVGAVVRLSDGPPGDSTWQVVRQQRRSSGFNSSRQRVLRLYAGDHAGPYHVTVTLPNGAGERVYTDVADLDVLAVR